jgi:hypothetical protein
MKQIILVFYFNNTFSSTNTIYLKAFEKVEDKLLYLFNERSKWKFNSFESTTAENLLEKVLCNLLQTWRINRSIDLLATFTYQEYFNDFKLHLQKNI